LSLRILAKGKAKFAEAKEKNLSLRKTSSNQSDSSTVIEITAKEAGGEDTDTRTPRTPQADMQPAHKALPTQS
jgi:hypothetical protein